MYVVSDRYWIVFKRRDGPRTGRPNRKALIKPHSFVARAWRLHDIHSLGVGTSSVHVEANRLDVANASLTLRRLTP